jgi:hypothetical protein
MKDPLTELENRIGALRTDPTTESLDEIVDVLQAIVTELKRIDGMAYRAANTASCLANGIQPD